MGHSPHRLNSPGDGFSGLCDSAACVGRSENMEDKAMTKVKDLTPSTKQVNVRVKVLGLSEEREITSKFGEARKLVEATVGEETGSSSSGPSAATAVAAAAGTGTDGTAVGAGTERNRFSSSWPSGQGPFFRLREREC